jgi:hypothetical protein
MLYRRFPLPAAGPIHTPAAFGSRGPNPQKRLSNSHLHLSGRRPPQIEGGHVSTTSSCPGRRGIRQ